MIWDASPIIVSIGPAAVRWYGLMFLVGFMLSLFIMKKICVWENKPALKMDSLLTHVFLGTLIGARLGHMLFYEPAALIEDPISVFKIWEGGLASHGGGIGVIIAVYLFHRKNPEFGLMWLFDRCAMMTIMTGCLIRIGNLMNSEILGRPTDVPWAFIFTRVDQVPRHPAQLYESICYALVFLMCWFVYNRKKEKTPSGQLLGLAFACTFTARFLIEFVKEDQSAFEKGLILNMGQLLSLPFILVGAIMLFRSLRRAH